MRDGGNELAFQFVYFYFPGDVTEDRDSAKELAAGQYRGEVDADDFIFNGQLVCQVGPFFDAVGVERPLLDGVDPGISGMTIEAKQFVD